MVPERQLSALALTLNRILAPRANQLRHGTESNNHLIAIVLNKLITVVHLRICLHDELTTWGFKVLVACNVRDGENNTSQAESLHLIPERAGNTIGSTRYREAG